MHNTMKRMIFFIKLPQKKGRKNNEKNKNVKEKL